MEWVGVLKGAAGEQQQWQGKAGRELCLQSRDCVGFRQSQKLTDGGRENTHMTLSVCKRSCYSGKQTGNNRNITDGNMLIFCNEVSRKNGIAVPA